MDWKPAQKTSSLRSLILLMGSSVLLALGVTGWMLYRYGPSGNYSIQQGLISPSLVTQLSFDAPNPKTAGTSHYVFEKIRYSYEVQPNQKLSVDVTPEAYAAFYQLIANDQSSHDPALQAFFPAADNAQLTIYVRTESHAPWQDEVTPFQSVEISNKGNAYRILLYEDPATAPWVLFHHPGIYQQSRRVLAP